MLLHFPDWRPTYKEDLLSTALLPTAHEETEPNVRFEHQGGHSRGLPYANDHEP